MFLALVLTHNSAQAEDSRSIAALSIALMNTCLAQDPTQARLVLDRMVVELTNETFWKDVPEDERAAMRKYQSSMPPELRERNYNAAISSFVESEWAVCVRRKQWLSKELCQDFLSYFRRQAFENLSPVFDKHRSEIKSKAELFTYMEKSFGRKQPTTSCPE